MISSDCYFDECNSCEFQECNNDTIICLINRLGLAFYQMIKDIPVLKEFVNDYKYCYWYVEKK